jgi:hypothetical protein
MEPEGLSPYLQDLAVSNSHDPSYFSKIHFNIFLPPTSSSYRRKWQYFFDSFVHDLTTQSAVVTIYTIY